jgi:hypothetical protein
MASERARKGTNHAVVTFSLARGEKYSPVRRRRGDGVRAAMMDTFSRARPTLIQDRRLAGHHSGDGRGHRDRTRQGERTTLGPFAARGLARSGLGLEGLVRG